MNINIFEGARRAGKLFLGLVIVIGMSMAIFGNGSTSFAEVTGWTIGVALFFFGVFLATGWIMRGLLGIPRGQDFKQ
jgi:hypothetical protein